MSDKQKFTIVSSDGSVVEEPMDGHCPCCGKQLQNPSTIKATITNKADQIIKGKMQLFTGPTDSENKD